MLESVLHFALYFPKVSMIINGLLMVNNLLTDTLRDETYEHII